MNVPERVSSLLADLKAYFRGKPVQEDVAYWAFIVTLLPVPLVQQAAQVVDRILSNQVLKTNLRELWDAITDLNSRISSIDDDLSRVKETAATVQRNPSLNAQLRNLLEQFVQDIQANTQWIMETETWSYQELLNSTVEADFAAVVSREHSTNVVEDTEIRAKTTHLHASGASKNYFDRAKFVGPAGRVGMQGISTEGDLVVRDSSIGFRPGAKLVFGGNPNGVAGRCPFCGANVQADRRELRMFARVKCPGCGKIMRYTLG